eukprot:TRINITY_DN962_c0_g1_i1.p1 TRINITY_DN962_c0_g1~~TRINITY_DN962_c0_g1_i1.p1  ORF type:complete len:51 (-),score=5.08 TRINITY_DN962_c0_g1_i1:113-265(-)
MFFCFLFLCFVYCLVCLCGKYQVGTNRYLCFCGLLQIGLFNKSGTRTSTC